MTLVEESVSRSVRPRIQTLDVIRGFALCGILAVNIPQLAGMTMHVTGLDGHPIDPVANFLNLAVQLRFFPIFSFLFGVSFALFFESARQRTSHPRVVLLRRLVALLLLGVLHSLIYPGEALLPYALVGIVVLLPATFIPQTGIVLGIGCVLTALALWQHGGQLLIPGLFLLGLGVARTGILETLAQRTRTFAIVFVVSVAASIPALIWSIGDPLGMGAFSQSPSGAIAGFVMAVAYTSGLALLMNTRASAFLTPLFAPLGRMALTNYVTATLLVLGTVAVLRTDGSTEADWPLAAAIWGGILIAQWAFSTLWLRAFRYGPLEWLWRMATWWMIVPNRRATV